MTNNGINPKKYTSTIELEEIGAQIQNHASTYEQNVSHVTEIDFHTFSIRN